MIPTVKARNATSPIEIEVWTGADKDLKPHGRFAVLHITSNRKGRMWIMIEPEEWERLKDLVDEKLAAP